MPRTHQLPLSLKHFDPVKQPPPYVNTPRSVEACRIHGIQPVELLHKPLHAFHESPDETDEIVWYRYMRHEESRKRLLQRAAQTRHELVQSGWASSDGEGTPTLVAQQAKHAAWAEQRELFELQKMIMHELQQAYQLQALKENLEKQETAFDKIDEQKRAVQKKLHEHRKQLVEEAAEKEREAERRLARAKNLERKKAVEEQLKQQEEELRAKREAEQKEAMRVRAVQEAKQARERITNMQETVHQEKIKRLAERNSLRQHKTRTQQQARDALQEAKFREAARKREKAAEAMRSREDAKLRATTDHVDEYEHRARVRQMQMDGLREQMRQHAERVAEAHRKRKEQLDERMERQKGALLAKLDKKQQDSEASRAKTQAQREQQAAMRKIRHDEWLQSQERKRRAQSYWMEQVSQSVETKEWKHGAIQHTKRELAHVTGNIKQAIRKTRAELREEFRQLHKMDAYTPEAILEVVDRLADELLIPHIQSTWEDAGRPRGSPNGALFGLRGDGFSADDGDEDLLSGNEDTSVHQPADADLNLGDRGGVARPTTAPEAATRSRVELSKHYPNTARGLAGASASPPRSPLRAFAPAVDKTHIMRALLIENERLKHQHQQRQQSSRRCGAEARWSDTPARSLPPFQLRPPSRLGTCLGDKPMSARPKPRKRRRSKFNVSLSDYQWNTNAPASLEASQISSFDNTATPTTRGGGERVEKAAQGNPQSSTQSSARVVPTERARDSSLSARPSEAASTDLSPPDKLQELSSSFSALAHVRKSQSQLLMTILSQEQHAEMERQDALAKCANAEERHALELAFAEERTRASQRILQLTQEHEAELKRLSQELQAEAETTQQ